MDWFKRIKEGITTQTHQKKETPDGLWNKCPKCKKIVSSEEFKLSLSVCQHCNYHARIGSIEYFDILFDKNSITELNKNLLSADPLNFKDTKKYSDRLKGSVVGEKIARAIDFAREKKYPLIIISKSGGARMMEAAISLMQLAKTSSKLAKLDSDGIPYLSLLTDPTFGGATASFSMLGDMNIAEPNALIGFAGPRVVKETIGKDLPEGFQTSEFLKEHGFIDLIVERKNLKEKLSQILRMISK